MTVGMWAIGLWVAACIAGLIIHLLGIYNREARLTNEPEHDVFWILSKLSLLIVMSFFIAIASGIALERSWVRPLIPAFWLYAGFEIIVFHQASPESRLYFFLKLSVTTGIGGFSCWYFYVRKNVVNYYRALAERRSFEDSPTGA
jgi:hypothetical protein